MAEIPTVVLDFTRMALRAFYSDVYVVVADIILFERNYAKEETIVEKLAGSAAKDVRAILDLMKRALILRCEKRTQRRVVEKKGPGWFRSVTSQFWFVDFQTFLDLVRYRFHFMRLGIKHRIENELEHQKYVCENCARSYTALDVNRLVDFNTGMLVCDKQLGRKRVCRGAVVEEDTQGEEQRARELQNTLESQLRPLVELLEACDGVHVPAHPLEGADEAVWGKYVPETVDGTGRSVNIHVSEFETYGARPNAVAVELVDSNADQVTAPSQDSMIPEKPVWFQQEGLAAGGQKPAEVQATMLSKKDPAVPSGGAEAAAAGTSGSAYYEAYLRDQQAQQQHEGADTAAAVAPIKGEEEEGEEEFDANFVDVPSSIPTGLDVPSRPQQQQSEQEELFVMVGETKLKLDEITEEHTEKMTPTEYEDYYAKLRLAGYIEVEE
ncbi:General transcription factor IIE subunit 1 [Porphyridium purpureum]|uniref:General transcription factor IIE subunit 1 n=1 Tax=Porphyridium purpureum TaxID=35688 RepID=A0A5J4YZ42_PORPP|nr:General transcription factor IIE subunit 1 [Porphyridium purpureum]|eukprot:POR0633..scf208_2